LIASAGDGSVDGDRKQLGARSATVSDPITNLALRSRLFYGGNASKVYVALDVLYES
jgi:hypothetical protein